MSEVTKYIPHRPPFLFVDEIIETSYDRIVTRKKIDADEEFFKGHYPGNPIMPGVLLCEAIFQSGAILIAKNIGGEIDGTPVLTRINNAKFKNMVKPGDLVTIEVNLKEKLSNAFFMRGKASVDGKVAVIVEFACCLADT